MIRFSYLAATALIIAACSHIVQTTSGADYLSKFDAPGSAAVLSPALTTDLYADTGIVASSESALIREAASVEPLLSFPARFGLARIEEGRVTSIPADEAALWNAMAQRFSGFGVFTPVDPIIMEFTSGSLPPSTAQAVSGRDGSVHYRARDLPSKIRLGAARQHLDAVLIYEVGMAEKSNRRPLTSIRLSTLGNTVLSDRTSEAAGAGKAILLDVRNGYPYGTAQIEKDLSGYAGSWHTSSARSKRREAARQRIAADLVPEVEDMLRSLINEIQAKRLRAAR